MRPKIFVSAYLLFSLHSLGAQNHPAKDSMIYLREITLVGQKLNRDIVQLPEIVGTNIYAGKKNALIVMDNLNTVVVNNNMRQIMAKVPGIHIWESDGSGIQIGIAARGLSANRSWEFNIRQNGCDIAADPFGYPEAYYNPQMQAIQRIQVVRGAGSLQYGPQFGGMVNYIMRDGSDIQKPFQFETRQTIGSFGLINTFNAVGGQTKKLSYYAFADHRQAEGYRQNSRYRTTTGFASLTWTPRAGIKLKTELMHYDMFSQQPGGLSEIEYLSGNMKQSSRSRNWFSTPWSTANIKLDWQIALHTRIQATLHGMAGDRSSTGFMQSITVPDTIVNSTGTYANREVAIDNYRNASFEAQVLHDYQLLGKTQTLSAGVRYFTGKTRRRAKGKGSNGTSADYSITETSFPSDALFLSSNAAFFAENAIRAGKRWIVVPGIRLESVVVDASGRLSYGAGGVENRMTDEKRHRFFALAGIGVEYHIKPDLELYGNITQAYRPVLFSNVSNPTTDIVDPELKDSRGWNSDLGVRGHLGAHVFADLSVYCLRYNQRIGTLSRLNASNQVYRYITNVGNSESKGLEILIDADWLSALNSRFTSRFGSFPVFVSATFNRSTYLGYSMTEVSGSTITEKNLKGNAVENAPGTIVRAGLSYRRRSVQVTLQASHVSSTFADANNTVTPSANGQNGLIPSYTIYDLNAAWTISPRFSLKMALNNLSNSRYFTRRAGGYPGPGILPSDGRSFLLTMGATL
ncbi:MAG: TonB-dependent receptor [Bacteroidetes bacterium]|nr:TonB-dependent receptor [Bacteroidota bacterium]